ncbi:MAG: site-specific integrase, partial [Salibacteraceae bacterium]
MKTKLSRQFNKAKLSALSFPMWETYKKGFSAYLRLERSLSKNSIDAYLSDVEKLVSFLNSTSQLKHPNQIDPNTLNQFVSWINELGLATYSQARIISGIKAFFKFLVLDEVLKEDPSEQLESPKLGRKLPDTLNNAEVE